MDVGDVRARETFLRRDVPRMLARLETRSTPRWGRMTPQQMVEHLLWAVEMSTGQAELEGDFSEEGRHRAFLDSDAPSPREFMNPALTQGLPPLRFDDLSGAVAALERELTAFLDAGAEAGEPRLHPIFGLLDYGGWHRVHYKHFHHHLTQFGLDGEEG